MRDLTNELNWDVVEKPLFVGGESFIPGATVISDPLANFKAINRNDNDSTIHVHKKSYQPFTNTSLIELADRLALASRGSVVGYNEFKEGRKVLAFVKSGNNTASINGNSIEDYIVIGNSHDGSSGVFIGTTTTLIRCENQFSQIQKDHVIRHTLNMDLKIEEAVGMYQAYYEAREIMYGKFREMSKVKIDDKIIESLTDRLFDIDRKAMGDEDLSTRKKNNLEVFNSAVDREMTDLGKNMWGFFNGVTYYTTHKRGTNSPSFDRNNSFGNVVGSNANFNKKAIGIISNEMAVI